MHVQAVEKGLALELVEDPGLPATVIGDDLRLHQILLNLVGNAIKFTDRGTITLKIETGADQQVEEAISLHFSVSDTGIGIASDKLEQVFNSFEQVDSSYARKYGGTGLGLAISRQLTVLMGGRLWVESQPGQGSVFHLVLALEPCVDEQATSLQAEINPVVVPQHLRILVVDDNEVNRDLASMILEKEHRVTTAADGQEALELLGRVPFDLVLMDVQMPVLDGLATTRIIRSIEQQLPLQHQHLPAKLMDMLNSSLSGGHLHIIAMTAHAMGGDREMCLEAGMDTYITKPFQPAQLSEMLRSL